MEEKSESKEYKTAAEACAEIISREQGLADQIVVILKGLSISEAHNVLRAVNKTIDNTILI